jgi:3-phytase
VATVGDGDVVEDLEGVSIVYGANGTGYIILSSQGDSTYAVYDRAGNNAFLKSFTVGNNGTIDAATGTDGLDVTSSNLGGSFTGGMLVVHDESNSGGTTSNLKYVSLSQIVTVQQPPR